MRLLLVEDDIDTAQAIIAALEERGHQVNWVPDGADGLVAALAAKSDILIIDRMLPSLDGLSLVAKAREEGVTAPILMLTALGMVRERVEGLEGGADDYLVKPFSMVELVARVDVLARRAGSAPNLLTLGDLTLDRLERQVSRAGKVITLIPREFQLLEILLLHSPDVVTRAILLERVWKFRFDPGTNLVESHISRLRSKIDRDSATALIHTVRGEGYAARLAC